MCVGSNASPTRAVRVQSAPRSQTAYSVNSIAIASAPSMGGTSGFRSGNDLYGNSRLSRESQRAIARVSYVPVRNRRTPATIPNPNPAAAPLRGAPGSGTRMSAPSILNTVPKPPAPPNEVVP